MKKYLNKYFFYKLFISLRRLILFRKKKFFFNKNIIINEIISDKEEIFFGYYDLDPLNNKFKEILIHIRSKDSNKISLATYNLITKKINKFDKSELWNYQLGSRLSWVNNDQISANKVHNGIAKNYIWEKKNNDISVISKIDYPIFDWNKNCSRGLTLNFFGLDEFRHGYGYNLKNYHNPLDTSSLYLYEKSTNKINELIKINSIRKKISNQNIKLVHFNHPKWSPNGDSFIVLFVYNKNNLRKSKLVYYDISNSEAILWNSELIDYISHFCWLNNNEIIFSGKLNNNKFGYYKGFINSRKIEKISEINTLSDGHPTYNNNHNILIFDTYPDRFSEQSLFYLNMNNNSLFKICKLLSPFKFMSYNKCDLHPRITNNGDTIIIDTAYSGKRSIMLLNNFKIKHQK